jgi:hypothetical protein
MRVHECVKTTGQVAYETWMAQCAEPEPWPEWAALPEPERKRWQLAAWAVQMYGRRVVVVEQGRQGV